MRFAAALFFLFAFQNSYGQVQEFLKPIESKVFNVNVKNTDEENIKKKAIEIFESYKLNARKIDEPSSKQICDLTKKVNEWTDCKGSRENNTKTVKYIGEFKDGKHHGFGKEILTNGTQFTGYYENNQRIYGLLNLPSSSIFVSYAGAGKIEGNVLHLEKDGSLYVGGFSNSKKNGVGLLIASNNIIVMGNFVEGVLVENKNTNSSPQLNNASLNSNVLSNNNKDKINEVSNGENKYFSIKDINLGYKYPASKDKKNCKLQFEINDRSYYECKSANTSILGKDWSVGTVYLNDERVIVSTSILKWDSNEDLVAYNNELAKNISVRFGAEPIIKSRKINTIEKFFEIRKVFWENQGNCTADDVLGRTKCKDPTLNAILSDTQDARRICGECPALNTELIWENSLNLVRMESQIQEFKNSPIPFGLRVTYAKMDIMQLMIKDRNEHNKKKIENQNELKNNKSIQLKLKKENDKNDF
jgi:hypothetical protein